MKIITMIPARMASTRLPGKPLALIQGKPMILHVMERAKEAQLGPVVVACCADSEIAPLVRRYGGQVVETDPHLPSGTDRIHDVLKRIDPHQKYDVVINLQGDLPLIQPKLIRQVVEPLHNFDVDIATLAAIITDSHEINNPNVVKIAMGAFEKIRGQKIVGNAENHGIVGESARAIYFSRESIPANALTYYHHVGIYAYRRPALEKFVALPPSHLECIEKLEQLRALEAGMRIDVTLINHIPQSVDTQEDLMRLQ